MQIKTTQYLHLLQDILTIGAEEAANTENAEVSHNQDIFNKLRNMKDLTRNSSPSTPPLRLGSFAKNPSDFEGWFQSNKTIH